MGNNSNCCTILEHKKAIFLISPWEVSYTNVSKSEWTSKQKYRSYFQSVGMKTNLYCKCLIAFPQGGFIDPHVWEIVWRKILIIFKVCHDSRFYITISLSFQKIETKNLNSDPRISIFLVLGTNQQLHISYLNIRSDHDIEAAIRGYS